MGASFSSFKLCSSEREQPFRAVVLSSDSSNYNTTTRSAEFWKKKKQILMIMMNKKKKKRQSDHHQPDENMVAKIIRKFTLEELIMASPSRPDCFTNGGDLHVFNHSYKRVHPSSTAVLHTDLSSKATDSFTLERRELHDIHEEADHEVLESVDSLISTSQTGKLKKKVSFKLPEEADIIVFY